MPRTKIPLEDIHDVEGFAAAVARRLNQRATPDEIQEATAEGIALLYKLHGDWDPERCASFYSYCTTYLPFRLIRWWQTELRQRLLGHRAGNGYVYHGRVSLEERQEHVDRLDRTEAHGKANQREDAALIAHDSHRLGE